MTKAHAIERFRSCYFDGKQSFYAALKADRLAVQYDLEVFMDSLLRKGTITEHQFYSWTFPWKKKAR